MKTKHLLTGLVLPALLAACTAEEVVEQQAVVKNDLSARPIVGNVTLNTGAEGRATLGEGWNSLLFEEGDKIGARIMDTYTPYTGSACAEEEDCENCTNPFWNYTISNDFASSNYQYINGGNGNWETDALMVEGNYMFYFPYNDEFLGRGPVKVTLPLKQNVSENDNTKPIQDLYEGENPFLVAYNFLPAVGQDATLGLDFQHIFAYPKITLKNTYKYFEDADDKKGVAKAITVDKIVIESVSGLIKNEGYIKHKELAKALNNVLIDECENEYHAAKEAGEWVTLNDEGRVKPGTFKKYIKAATTDGIVNFAEGEESYITVDIEDITLEPGETFSFYAVMPALKYTKDDLKITVYLADNKMIQEKIPFKTIEDEITFVPGKRYPKEEYNFNGVNATPKTTAGALATFNLEGTIVDAVAPIKPIGTIADFEAMLDAIADNTLTLKEGTKAEVHEGKAQFYLALDKDDKPILEINDEVMALLDKYLADGTIVFTQKPMVVKATALDNIHFDNVVFASEVTINENVKATAATIESGKVTIADKDDIELGTVTVKAGELVVNKAEVLGTNNKVVVYQTEEEEEVIATGTLTINKANSLDNVTMAVDGNIAINAAVKVKENNIITAGTITNNSTITLEADWTVKDDVVLMNNGKFAGVYDLNNEGKIETTKNLAVNTNSGLIVVKDDNITLDVTAGTGKVDNTEAGMVTATTNTVYAELSEITSVKEDIIEAYDKASGVTTIVATGTWSARSAETLSYDNTNVNKIVFKGATLNMASVTLDLTHFDVEISANTTWNGRGDQSIVDVKSLTYNKYDSDADETEDTYYTLTIDKVNVKVNNAVINAQAEALKQAAANGGNVTLTSDVELTAGYTLNKSLNLNLNGKTLTFDSSDILYRVNSGATLTISGGTVEGDGYVASSNVGGVVNVTSGTYTCGVTCFQSNGGELNISGGTFKAEPYNGVYYTINYIDAQNHSEKIKISGGTFYNFNPACSRSENPEDNFLAADKVVKVYENELTNEVTNLKPRTSGDTSKTYAQQPCLGSWVNTYIYVVE